MRLHRNDFAIENEHGQRIYVRSMGNALRVVAIFLTVEAANRYCARHKDVGVIAEFGPCIFLANLYDPGLPIPREAP